MVFHAGTAERDGQIIATGGRVLNVTARGDTLAEARNARLCDDRPHRLARRLLPPRHRLAGASTEVERLPRKSFVSSSAFASSSGCAADAGSI